jgi:16S rRNA processing protein RimM
MSYADPPESLLKHRIWHLRRADGSIDQVEVVKSQWDGHALRVELEGVQDRDAAERLHHREILIERDQLPEPAPGQHYREDLEGFTVRNCEGVTLGKLSYFLEAPAGALMVVIGEGDKERWLPTGPSFIRRIDAGQREIEVDWPADF